jgi:hypothetical protein
MYCITLSDGENIRTTELQFRETGKDSISSVEEPFYDKGKQVMIKDEERAGYKADASKAGNNTFLEWKLNQYIILGN